MVKKKNNITVIVIIIVSIVIVGGVVTWGFLTDWGQEKKSEPVKYTVLKKIPKGTNKIEIENPESYGFKIGQEIEIGTGESRERRTIVGFGSLILDRPLTREYPKNTVITVVEEPVKKDFKVDNCKEYTVDLMCKECGDSYYLEYNKCKKYSYTENECNGERQIFRKGTYTSNSQCEDCRKEQWIKTLDDGTKQCTSYKYTSENCKRKDGKIFTAGTSLTSDNSTCKDCITECKSKKIEEETQECTKSNCKFSIRSDKCTSCPNGRCDQTNCNKPICGGGRCDQSNSVDASCGGGGCKQTNSVDASCAGGCYTKDCKDNCRDEVDEDMVARMCSQQCESNQ